MIKSIFRRHSILIILLLLSCQKDELKRTYPILLTNAVTNITTQGATFSASFSNAIPEEIVDCGFVWGVNPDLTVEGSLHIQLGKPTNQSFSVEAKSSLLPKIQYNLRPYVRTKYITIYGKQVQFISLGSTAPVLDDFFPKKAKAGDTITITGKYFGQNLPETKVIFESTTNQVPVLVSPLKLQDNQAKVIVPEDLTERFTVIKLQVLGNASRAPGNFELIQPLITTLGAQPVQYFDSITVNYQNNGFSLTQVFVNGASVPARITPQYVRFLLRVPPDPMTVSIRSNALTNEKTFSGFVQPPTVIGLPQSIATGDTISLAWSYPLPTPLTVQTGTLVGNIYSFNQTKSGIQTVLPPCTRTGGTFRISAPDFTFESNPYDLNRPQMISVSPLDVVPGNLITITGKNFYPDKGSSYLIIAGSYVSINSMTKTEIKAVIPEIASNYIPSDPGALDIQLITCTTAEPYHLTGHLKAPIVTSVTPTTITSPSQFVTITGDNFIPAPNQTNNEVSIGGYKAAVYSSTKTQIVVTIDFDPSVSLYLQSNLNVKVLNQSTSGPLTTIDFHGLWTQHSTPSIDPRLNVSFGLGSKGYAGLGYNNGLLKHFWEYDPATDSWIALPDFPGESRFNPVYFTALGKAYIGLGYNLDYPGGQKYYNDFWEYNPSTKQWTQIASLPGVGRSQSMAFSSSALGFAGGGIDKNGNSLTDFYQFDPSNGSWTRLTDVPILNTWGSITFNNKGYVYGSASTLTRGAIFDIATKVWTIDNTIPSVTQPSYPQSLPLPFKTIIGTNIYNPETKSKTQLPGPYATMGGETGFVVNGIGYVFYVDASSQRYFVSFDPTK